jgi:hypothetical protein
MIVVGGADSFLSVIEGLGQLMLLEYTWWSRRCGRRSGDWKSIEECEKPLDCCDGDNNLTRVDVPLLICVGCSL